MVIYSVLFLSDDHRSRGSGLAPWPARLTAPPPRLADFGYSSEMWEKDMVILRPNISLSLSLYVLFSCISQRPLYFCGICTATLAAEG